MSRKPHGQARLRLHGRLYGRLEARFDQGEDDPRAGLVNLVDVMLVFACGLIAAVTSSQGGLKTPQPVEKGRQIERPDAGLARPGSGYDRVGEVYRDPKTGKLVLIEAAGPK